MGFKKGKSGNPNGRPKGRCNTVTKEILNINALSSLNHDEIISYLMQNIRDNKPWAFQIYFNRIYDPIKRTQISNSADNRVDSVINAIKSFDFLTHDELLSELKIFKDIKEKQELAQEQNLLEILPDELVKEIYKIYTGLNEKKEMSD